MSLQLFTGANIAKQLQDNDLIVIEGATVSVHNRTTGSLAVLWQDSAGTITQINPFTADDTGQFSFYINSGEYKFTVTKGPITGFVFFEVSNTQKIFTPEDYGAIGGGADDTIAVQACFNNSEFSLIDKVYCVAPVTAPNHVHCINEGFLKYIGVQNGRMLTITSRTMGVLHLDGNLKDVANGFVPSGLGYKQTIQGVVTKNVRASASSDTTVTGFSCFGDDVELGWVTGFNNLNSGQINGSFPQALVTGSGTYNIAGPIILRNCQSGLVTTGGKVVFDKTDMEGMVDNGLYLLGGEVKGGSHLYQGDEETCVVSNTDLELAQITTIGRCFNAFNYQNAKRINIGRIISKAPEGTLPGDLSNNVARFICIARSGNISSGPIEIGSVEGIFSQGLYGTNSGSCESFTVKKNVSNLLYSPGVNTSWDVANWLNFNGCAQINIKDHDIKIIDDEGAITAIPFTINTPVFTSHSSIENLDITFFNTDGTVNTTGIYNGGKPKLLLRYKGAIWQTSAGPHAREITYRSGQRNTMQAGVPTTGYWIKGESYDINNYDGNPTQHIKNICTVTGTPGTWIQYGKMITGVGNPNGTVTPNYVGEHYRDTGTQNIYTAYGSANTNWGI